MSGGDFGKSVRRMILCIGTTPAAQRVMIFRKLELDKVNRALKTLDGIAGKSINVAKVLATLGAQPVATGFVGGERGTEIARQLASRKIETDFVLVRSLTRQCITVLNECTEEVTELVEESQGVALEDYDALEAIIEKRLPGCRAVVMSGSLTPGGPVEFYQKITRKANVLRIISIVDAQGAPLMQALEVRPGLVKPNRQELAATVGHSLNTESEVITAMHDVRQRGAERVVVTAGKSPALALDAEHLWRIEPPTVRVVNPIGSGDAFTAGLVWRLVQKDDLGQACRWAAAAGAANALSAMPGDLERNDVERLADQVKLTKL